MGRKSRLKWERRNRDGWPFRGLDSRYVEGQMAKTRARLLASIAPAIVATTTAERKEPPHAR